MPHPKDRKNMDMLEYINPVLRCDLADSCRRASSSLSSNSYYITKKIYMQLNLKTKIRIKYNKKS